MSAERIRKLHAIIDLRIAAAAGRVVSRGGAAESAVDTARNQFDHLRGTVTEVIPSLRRAMVVLDGLSTPVAAVYPALPVTLVAGDEVVVQRRQDGWLLIVQVLGRDAAAAAAAATGQAFPIGSVFIAVVATDPATLLGYGTWVAFGAGRVLVGQDPLDASFDAAEETGGAKTVAAQGSVAAPTISGSVANESAHTHDLGNHKHQLPFAGISATVLRRLGMAAFGQSASTETAAATITSSAASNTNETLMHSNVPTTNASGAGSAHGHGAGTLAASAPAFTGSATSVVQPYIVVYMWKRTA